MKTEIPIVKQSTEAEFYVYSNDLVNYDDEFELNVLGIKKSLSICNDLYHIIYGDYYVR